MARSFCEVDWSIVAAWVQAIGSIIAIAVAIWIPFNLDKRSRSNAAAEKATRSRIVQASLLPSLYELRSTTSDFIQEHTAEKSLLGASIEPSDFNSNFFELVPQFKNILIVALDAGEVQDDITRLSVILFKTNELLSDNIKLQRDGYHAAWLNHKDLFIKSAIEINTQCNKVINSIESRYQT